MLIAEAGNRLQGKVSAIRLQFQDAAEPSVASMQHGNFLPAPLSRGAADFN